VDERNVLFWNGDATLRFLLKSVENINSFRITNRVHRPPRVAAMPGDNLKHRASAKTSQCFRSWVSFTLLGGIESLADIAPDLAWKFTHINSARTDPDYRPFRCLHYT